MTARPGSATRPPPDRLRVILMDDTPELRVLMRVALEGSGRFVVIGEAGDGASGMELVRRNEPDVVVLDLAMPIMDGMATLAQLRLESPATRVIVLSAFESVRMAERTKAAGAIAYIQKGAPVQRIIASMCVALGQAEIGTELGAVPEPPPPAPRSASPGNVEWDPTATATRAELDRVQAALASAAHELRGPATVLLAMTELLSTERDALDALTFNRMLDAIQRQAQVLDRVTSDLLTSTQSHRGVLTVDVAPMLLRPLLDGATLSVASRSTVRVNCDAKLWVRADSTRVQQMLGNLVSNAVKYGAPPIHIVARATDGFAQVRVVDHGAGVPAEFRDRLFAEFSRAEGARVSGIGLGLFVMRSLTEAQGGRAWYEPVPQGGSAFCFTLPLADVADNVIAVSPRRSSAPPPAPT